MSVQEPELLEAAFFDMLDAFLRHYPNAQHELAQEFGVSVSSVDAWQRRQNCPHPALLPLAIQYMENKLKANL